MVDFIVVNLSSISSNSEHILEIWRSRTLFISPSNPSFLLRQSIIFLFSIEDLDKMVFLLFEGEDLFGKVMGWKILSWLFGIARYFFWKNSLSSSELSYSFCMLSAYLELGQVSFIPKQLAEWSVVTDVFLWYVFTALDINSFTSLD